MKWSGHCDNKGYWGEEYRKREDKVSGDGFPCHTEVTWVPERASLVERQSNVKNWPQGPSGKGQFMQETVRITNETSKKKVRNQTKPGKQANKHTETNERASRRLDMGKWDCVQRRLKTKAESQVKSHFNWRRNYRPDGFLSREKSVEVQEGKTLPNSC